MSGQDKMRPSDEASAGQLRSAKDQGPYLPERGSRDDAAQMDGHIIAQNIMHSQSDISPALVIFALASGFALGGIAAGLVAIPVFAAGRVLVRWLTVPRIRPRSVRRPLLAGGRQA